jgi:RNA polymerase sigma-70 factor (ECF subfamily)
MNDHGEPIMSRGYRTACVSEADRHSNEEFASMMAEVVRREKGAAQRLYRAVAPLLIAFYGGQVQAGRARREDLELLVQLALAAVYRDRASHATEDRPFRAWLLDIARSAMDGYDPARPGAMSAPGPVLGEASRSSIDRGAKSAARHDVEPPKTFTSLT